LLSLPAGGGGAASSVAGGQDPVLRPVLGVTGRLVSGYSLPPPAPSTSLVSWITLGVRVAGDRA